MVFVYMKFLDITLRKIRHPNERQFTEQGSHYDTVNMPQTFFQPGSAYSIGKKNLQKVT